MVDRGTRGNGGDKEGQDGGDGVGMGTGGDMEGQEGTWGDRRGHGDMGAQPNPQGDMGGSQTHGGTGRDMGGQPSPQEDIRIVGACRAPGWGGGFVPQFPHPALPAGLILPIGEAGGQRVASHVWVLGIPVPWGWQGRPMGVPVVPPCWAARSGAGSQSSGRVRPGTCTQRTGCPRP